MFTNLFIKIYKFLIKKKTRDEIKNFISIYRDQKFLDKQTAYNFHWFRKKFKIFEIEYYLVLNKKDLRSCRVFEKRQEKKIEFLINTIKKFEKNYFIDIGANYGEFSIPISHLAEKTISIEPNPEIFRTLKESVKNKKNIDIYQNAFFKVCKKIDFYKNSFHSGGCHIEGSKIAIEKRKLSHYLNFLNGSPNNHYQNFDIIETETINMEYLNKIYDLQKKNLIIKIDVEGLDLELSNYILNYLKTQNFKNFFLIMCEIGSNYYSEERKNKLKFFLDFALQNKYEIAQILNKDLKNQSIKIKKIHSINNFFDKSNNFEAGELIIKNFIS